MRKLTTLIISAFLLTAMSASADADGIPRKRKGSITKSAEAPDEAKLLDLLRQTQQAAEEARDEARRARQQSDSLDLKLGQAAREIAELRRMVDDRQSGAPDPQVSELKSQISELKSQISELKAQITDQKSLADNLKADLNSPALSESKPADPKTNDRLATLEE